MLKPLPLRIPSPVVLTVDLKSGTLCGALPNMSKAKG